MALHQISNNNPDILKKLEQVANSNDAVLLCGDGTYQCPRLKTQLAVYALHDDVEIRGLQLPENITAIDDSDWADLIIKYGTTVSWT